VFKVAKNTIYGFVAVAIIAVTMVAVFGRVRHTEAFIKATTHQPQPFTELSFANPDGLPATVTVGQKVPIQFVVHNLESRDMSYVYQVGYNYPSGGSALLGTQNLSLKNGESQKVSDEITIPAGKGRAEISVSNSNQQEAIHFWVEVK
jgi:hypothetical protein